MPLPRRACAAWTLFVRCMTLDPRIRAVLEDVGPGPDTASLPDDLDQVVAQVAAEMNAGVTPPPSTGGVGLVLGSSVVPRLLDANERAHPRRIDRLA